MRWPLAIVILIAPFPSYSQPTEESLIKFAFYSPSWGRVSSANLVSGLHLVVDNQTNSAVRLENIEFPANVVGTDPQVIGISLNIPAVGLAEQELPYVDLLSINQCVISTLDENWRLVEISNYTLNPSVRRLIIQDTTAFRIYQCVSSVTTNWINNNTGEKYSKDEWVLYHFERLPN